MKETLLKLIKDSVKVLYPDIETNSITITMTDGDSKEDFSTNVGSVLADILKKSSRTIGEEVAGQLCSIDLESVEKLEVVGPGQINFFLKDIYYNDVIKLILGQGHGYGASSDLHDERIMVEYTDPNPFKPFHSGHIVPNVIGESLTRLFEYAGAEVKRVNYQGDVGMHVAKAVWGMRKFSDEIPSESDSLVDKIAFLHASFVAGKTAYEKSNSYRDEIHTLNKNIYDQTNQNVNRYYDVGRRWSLQHFELIYKRLGTKFDNYFFESTTGQIGLEIVNDGFKKGIFKKVKGSVIFPGEKYNLHDRIFINKEGIPTYEAKELGLAKLKYETYRYNRSFIVAGGGVTEYFKVLHKAMQLVLPELANITKYIPNGSLKREFPEKPTLEGINMSIDLFLDGVIRLIEKEMVNRQKLTEIEHRATVKVLAIGAVKFAVLRYAVGENIIFSDMESVSLESNSGPYIQATYAKTRFVARKAQKNNLKADIGKHKEVGKIEKLLAQYPCIIKQCRNELEPHYLCSYLLELADEYNTFYKDEAILVEDSGLGYRLALTNAVSQVLKSGLYVLGIVAPAKV